jgi:hypothetical protein
MEIKLHSVIDIITNSSTEIFTRSGGCDTLLAELVNEFLKTFEINNTCDEIFQMLILASDKQIYYNYAENNKRLKLSDDDVEKQIEDVMSFKIEKPDWFKLAENKHDDDDGLPETSLHIFPKDPKYANIANLFSKFLYSLDQEAHYC